MSDHIRRAAVVVAEHMADPATGGIAAGSQVRCSCDVALEGLSRDHAETMHWRHVAQALDAAGLLGGLPRTEDGCACTPHSQDAGGGYTEHLLEYEPACPEHSEHLWDPRQGEWVLRSEHDAAVVARAWDEGHTAGVRNASAEFDGPVQDNPYERERGASDADA